MGEASYQPKTTGDGSYRPHIPVLTFGVRAIIIVLSLGSIIVALSGTYS